MLLKQKKQIANLYLWMKNQIANAVLRDDPASNEDTSSRVAMHDLSSLPVVSGTTPYKNRKRRKADEYRKHYQQNPPGYCTPLIYLI